MMAIPPGAELAASIVVDSWKDKKRIMQERYPGLTDADFCFEEGREGEMIDTLEHKKGLCILYGLYFNGYNFKYEESDKGLEMRD